ncbi:MAG: hypothetical protein WA781_21450, partial [Pseudolabrys sp.]
RCPGRYRLVENDGRVDAECPCVAAARCVRLSQYAADRSDRLLRRDRSPAKIETIVHCNDDQPIHVHAPPL